MSQNSTGEKTEPPTPKKLRDARSKGQVARSQEVVTMVSLFGVIAVMIAGGSFVYNQMVEMMDVAATMAQRSDSVVLLDAVGIMFHYSVAIMMPVLGMTILAGIAANYLQFGSLFAFENVMPKLEKISPSKGFKRIFSMKQVVEVLKSVFKIVFLSVVMYFVVRAAIGPYMDSVHCGMPCILQVTVRMMLVVLGLSLLSFTVVALLDFIYQKHTHIKGLKMSKDEVKREYKESEGDPMVKGQRKQLAYELVFSDAPTRAKKATAIIINPTHLAIALKYDEDAKDIPVVIAKGRNAQAVAIREAAEEAGVPVFLSVPVARVLFAETDIGDAIPDEMFEVVALILAWVARNRDALYAGPLPHGVIDLERDPAFAGLGPVA